MARPVDARLAAIIDAWWKSWPDALPAIDLAKVGLVVIDSDRHEDGPDGVTAWAAICAENGWTDVTPIVDTSGGGEHFYFRQPEKGKPLGNAEGNITGLGINVRGHGGYVIAPGAMLPDGRRWRGRKGAPCIVETFAHNRDAIPFIPDWLVKKLTARKRRERSETKEHPKGRAGARERAYAAKALELNAAELAATRENRNIKLNAIAFRMGRMIGAGWIDRAVVERALEGACFINGLGKTQDDYGCGGDASEVEKTMRSGIEAGIADPCPALPADDSAIKYYEDPGGAPGDGATDAPRYSDEALALIFAIKHHCDFRYVAAWSQWLGWMGTHWRRDETLRAREAARTICRDAANECKKGDPKKIASAKTVAAVETLAKADRRLAATSDQWDADPWLLNTPGGVLDLRTGECRAARPDDYMTKMTAVAPSGAGCPLFLEFINTICGSDAELIAYLQRSFGYALTGVTSEHALFFGYGTGANGKSVLLSTIADILGDYHKTASIETFTASNADHHPTDLAMLRGARLVTAMETEEGRRWAESRIKQLTGGDPISARFMRQDFFEFVPQFKLMVAGNHKPVLRSVNEAIRRRMNLIPFAVTIPPEERDKKLTEKLKAEWSGILQWMIEGCLKWQRIGLSPPKVVADGDLCVSRRRGRHRQLDRRLLRRGEAGTGRNRPALFASYKSWAERSGEPVGSTKLFAQNLESRGFERQKKETGQGFIGLRLVAV